MGYYNYEKILNLEMRHSNTDTTIKEFLKTLCFEIISRGSKFNAEAPFTVKGWEEDLVFPLVNEGIIEGYINEDGYLENYDKDESYQILIDCIKYIFKDENNTG